MARPFRAAAALALALTSVAMPARSLPLAGRLEIAMTWSPNRAPVNGTVTFRTSASDNDGAVRAVTLCYGDGVCQGFVDSLSTPETVTACVFGSNWDRQWQHRYTRTGRFSVTLTVTTQGCPGAGDETRSYTASLTVD